MKNRRLRQASESELKKLMFRMKKVYALWMIENIVNENPWCIEKPEFVNYSLCKLRKLYPTMECWGLKDVDRWIEMEKGVILLKITYWKSTNKELRDRELPYYISGLMTEKSYIVFAFNKDKIVTRSVCIDLELMPHTFTEEMMREIEYLKEEIDCRDIEPEDLFDEDLEDMNLN